MRVVPPLLLAWGSLCATIVCPSCKPSGPAAVAAGGADGSMTSGGGAGAGGADAAPANAGARGPEVLYDRPLMEPSALQADADSLYWVESRNTGTFLVKAPLAQATPPATPVDLGEAYGGDTQTQLIAVDATTVYWRYDDTVRKVPKEGGAVTTIQLGAEHSDGNGLLVERGDTLYVADHGCIAIGKVPKAGGAPTFFTVPPHAWPGRSTSLAVDDAYVYCGGGKVIYRAPLDGPDATPFLADQEFVSALLPMKDKLFWVNNKSDLQSRQENLASCAIAGGPSQSLGVVGGQSAILLLDEKRRQLYTVTGGGLNDERVLSYGLDDGALKTLASNLTTRWGVAQDDRYVYWSGDRAIMRIAKP